MDLQNRNCFATARNDLLADFLRVHQVLSDYKKRRAYHQWVKEQEMNYYRQMAYASHENHPFFACFMRFDNNNWMKDLMEKDSKKTKGD